MAGEGVQFRAVDQNGLESKVLALGEALRPTSATRARGHATQLSSPPSPSQSTLFSPSIGASWSITPAVWWPAALIATTETASWTR
ncbi:hypothetical protein ACWD4L_50320 [Streptomyces sp. NPDC002596]